MTDRNVFIVHRSDEGDVQAYQANKVHALVLTFLEAGDLGLWAAYEAIRRSENPPLTLVAVTYIRSLP